MIRGALVQRGPLRASRMVASVCPLSPAFMPHKKKALSQ
jgi:hypothetical protein